MILQLIGTFWTVRVATGHTQNSDVLDIPLAVHREGFSLLFYGFGSKKALLESFARECLTDGGVVVFNGYMHTMNIREILLKVASLLRVPRY